MTNIGDGFFERINRIKPYLPAADECELCSRCRQDWYDDLPYCWECLCQRYAMNNYVTPSGRSKLAATCPYVVLKRCGVDDVTAKVVDRGLDPGTRDRVWALDLGKSYYIGGTNGIGKTVRAAVHMLHALSDGWHCRLVLGMELDGLFRSRQTDFLESMQLLVIDDIGAGKFEGADLFQLLVRRAGRPTVITSNMRTDELSERFGQAAGRLAGFVNVEIQEKRNRRVVQ